MLYMGYLTIVGGHNIEKTPFRSFFHSFFSFFWVVEDENCMRRLCICPLGRSRLSTQWPNWGEKHTIRV